MRNRLVHRYEEIDHKMVYDALKPLLRNFRKYTQLIEDYLERGAARRKTRK